MHTNPLDRLLDIRDIARLTGYSRRHLQRLRQLNGFPRPVRVRPRSRPRWRRSDVVRWLNGLR